MCASCFVLTFLFRGAGVVAPEARLLSTPRVQGARFSPAEPIGALPRPTTARRIASSSTPPARLLLPRRSRPARAPRGRVRHARRAPIACQAAATRAAAQDPRALARPRSIGACACTAAAMARRNVRRWLRGRLVLGGALLAARCCNVLCQAGGDAAGMFTLCRMFGSCANSARAGLFW